MSDIAAIENQGYAFGILLHELDATPEIKSVFEKMAAVMPPEQFDELFLLLTEAVTEQKAIEADPEYQADMEKIEAEAAEKLQAIMSNSEDV